MAGSGKRASAAKTATRAASTRKVEQSAKAMPLRSGQDWHVNEFAPWGRMGAKKEVSPKQRASYTKMLSEERRLARLAHGSDAKRLTPKQKASALRDLRQVQARIESFDKSWPRAS